MDRKRFDRSVASVMCTDAHSGKARLFHNPRGNRESELMREYDLSTDCRWIGNSPAAAARHYATSIDLNADFRRAVGSEAQQKAQQSAAVCEKQGMSTEPAESENALEIQGYDTSEHGRT